VTSDGPDEDIYGYMLGESAAYDRFIESIRDYRSLHRVTGLPCRVYEWWDGGVPLTVWTRLGGKNVTKTFFACAERARGGDRLVEKTPDHLHYVDRAFEAYPEAHVLLLMRHPVEIYSSYRRRAQKQEDSWLQLSVSAFIDRYRRDARATENALDQYERTCLVRYEDFTEKAEEEFERICSFVDVEYERAPVEGGCDELSDWAPDPYLSRPITPSTKDWRDYLDEEEARKIEDAVAGVMKTFGYDGKAN
jgi:hypothetical protein